MADEGGPDPGAEPQSGEGGEGMHVHRPKPLHGWREILTEIGIVVIGIVIALGGEQALEAWRNHERLDHGEAALRANFTQILNWTAELDATRACVADRAHEVRAIIDTAGVRREIPRIGPIPKPLVHPWELSAWDEMVASGAAGQMPPDQAFLIASTAHSARNAQVADYAEAEAWSELGALAGAPRHFSEAEEASLRATLARAQNQSELLRIFGRTIETRILRTRLVDRDVAAAPAQRIRNLTGPERTSALPMCKPIERALR